MRRIPKSMCLTVSVFTPASSEGASEMLLRLELSSESGPDRGQISSFFYPTQRREEVNNQA